MSLKLFGKNTVVYAIGNVGIRAVSFILIPIYTHSLSIRDYGLLATLLLTIEFMLIGMNCGMRPALVRFTKEYEKTNRLAFLLGTSCMMNVAGGLVITGISLTFLIPVFRRVLHSDDVYFLIGMVCCISLMQSLCIHLIDYYRAQNKSIKYMIAGLVTAGVILISSYIFLYILRMGIRGALFAKLTTYALILLLISSNVLSGTGFKISFRLIPSLMKFGFPLIFSMSSELVIVGAGIYILSLFSGLETVAIYSLGQKLAMVLAMVLILPFQLSFQPFIFANLNSPQIKKQVSQLLTYLVLAISGVSFCILVGSRFILPYIGTEYTSAYKVILLLLPGIAFIGIYYFAETLLTAVKKTSIIGLTMTICTICSVILNYILIKSINQYGAIIVTNATFTIAGLSLFIIGWKKFPIPFELKRLGMAIGLFLAVILLNVALLRVNNSNYYLISTISVCAMGCILHFSSFYNEQEKMLLRKVVKKVMTILPKSNIQGEPINNLNLTREESSK